MNDLIASLHTVSYAGISLVEYAYALGVVFLFFIFKSYAAKRVSGLIGLIAERTKTEHDDALSVALKEPLAFLFMLIGFYIAMELLPLNSDYESYIQKILRSLSYIGFGWISFLVMDFLAKVAVERLGRSERRFRGELVNFVIKGVKTLVVIGVVLSILSGWEYDVSALIASLGLGGVAFALAAKDTIVHLFGSMVLLWDRPFKHGDWIVADGVEGTVVEIGIRSTTIRTFDNALVTVPNADLANATITNWSRREVGRRIKMHVGVVYGTTPEQLKRIVHQIKTMLNSHEGVVTDLPAGNSTIVSERDQKGIKDTFIVNVDRFGASSIDILIYCFSRTTNWYEWLDIKEDIMYKIMEIVKAEGSDFAFPSQSLYLHHEEKPKEESL